MKRLISLTLILLFLTACATNPRKRFLYGAAIGGGTGVVGGAVLSPNSESRGVNTLVFGLVGAVAGAAFALFSRDDSEIPESANSLEQREASRDAEIYVTDTSSQKLPDFVKERLTPTVVEEYTENGPVTEDGLLHEPHKVWRIKRAPELVAKPRSKK